MSEISTPETWEPSQALADYEAENAEINWSKIPANKDYPPRLVVPDGTAWDDPEIGHYELERDAYHYYVSQQTRDDFKAGNYGTHPEVVTDALEEYFLALGYQLDSQSRPLFPYGPTGVGGLGGNWHYGGRGTSDIVITRHLKDKEFADGIVVRKIGKPKPATPGGFINLEEGESPLDGAKREAPEETQIDLDEASVVRFLGRTICRSGSTTDHSWRETNGFHFHLEGEAALQGARGRDDAAGDNIKTGAFWVPLVSESVVGMSPHHLVWFKTAAELGELAVDL